MIDPLRHLIQAIAGIVPPDGELRCAAERQLGDSIIPEETPDAPALEKLARRILVFNRRGKSVWRRLVFPLFVILACAAGLSGSVRQSFAELRMTAPYPQ